jgi:hypothetical protein
MTVTLEGQKESASTPRGGLGSTLQPSGCGESTDQLARMCVSDQSFVLAPSLAREILMKQIHGEFS